MLDLNSLFSEVALDSVKDFPSFDFSHSSKPSDFLAQRINQRNNLAGRLERLITEPKISGHPFIQYIFQNAPDVTEDELRTVAKAVERVADILEAYKAIDEEVRALSFIHSHPNVIACAFGKFNAPDPNYFTDAISSENTDV